MLVLKTLAVLELISKDSRWSGYRNSSDSIEESVGKTIRIGRGGSDLTFNKVDPPHDTPYPSENKDGRDHLDASYK